MHSRCTKLVSSVPDRDIPLGDLVPLNETIVRGSPSEGRMSSEISTKLGRATLEFEGQSEALQLYMDTVFVAAGAVSSEAAEFSIDLEQIVLNALEQGQGLLDRAVLRSASESFLQQVAAGVERGDLDIEDLVGIDLLGSIAEILESRSEEYVPGEAEITVTAGFLPDEAAEPVKWHIYVDPNCLPRCTYWSPRISVTVTKGVVSVNGRQVCTGHNVVRYNVVTVTAWDSTNSFEKHLYN
jgi:hypothetical protein